MPASGTLNSSVMMPPGDCGRRWIDHQRAPMTVAELAHTCDVAGLHQGIRRRFRHHARDAAAPRLEQVLELFEIQRRMDGMTLRAVRRELADRLDRVHEEPPELDPFAAAGRREAPGDRAMDRTHGTHAEAAEVDVIR